MIPVLRLNTLLLAGYVCLFQMTGAWSQSFMSKSDQSVMLVEGHNAVVNKQYSLAIEILTKVITTPNIDRLSQAQAILRRGVALYQLGKIKAAGANLDYAFQMGVLPAGEIKDLVLIRSKVYAALGNMPKAQQDQTVFAKLNQQRYNIKNSYDEAPTVTASLSAGKNGSSRALLQQSDNAIVAGQNKRAVKMLNTLLEKETLVHSVRAKAYFQRGVAHQRLGKIAESIADFSNAEMLGKLPKSVMRDLLFNRAKSYLAVGMHSLALKDKIALQKIDGVITTQSGAMGAPLTTASVGGKGKRGQIKKKRYSRTYVATAKPKNLVEHLTVFFSKK